jgi:hypothetical protein
MIRVLDFGIVPSVWYYLILILSINEYLQHRFPVSSEHLWNLLGHPFGICWPLFCLLFIDIRILITPLVSFDHCVVCSSSIYGFWLPIWYLLTIVLSVLHRYTDSDYPFGIFKLFLKLVIISFQSDDRWKAHQNPYIDEEQTKQWSKDAKGVIRIRISMKNR